MLSILKDIKVVELSTVLAGPAVGTFFVECGADVTKIENLNQGGDVTRSWKTEGEKQTISAYYASVNHGKTVANLDLKNEEDLKSCQKLIREADIVISNFRESSAQKFGLDYEGLKSLNPKIILGTIRGFANSSRPAYDAVLQAETGFMSMNGTKDGPPTKMPVALIDILAAHQLKEGLLLALIQKMKTGRGSQVSVSLEETAIASLANQASNYLMNGLIAERRGSLHPNIAPYGELLETKDGKLLILAIGNDLQFSKICRILNLEELLENPLFKDNPGRVKNRKLLHGKMTEASKNFQFIDLYEQCLNAQIPVGEIKTLDQVLESDVARNLSVKDIIEGSETLRIQSSVFKIGS